MRRLRPFLLTTLLFSPWAATPGTAGSPSATLTWEAEEAREAAGALLLVLELGPEGFRLLDARSSPAKAKVRRSQAEWDAPVFGLFDRDGRPLLAGHLRIPEALHGPVLDERGELRCVSLPLERATFAVRLPMPAGAAELRLYEAASFAPTTGPALGAALSARAVDAGLQRVASFDLTGLGAAAE